MSPLPEFPRRSNRGVSWLLLLCLALPLPVVADSGLLTSTLGRWLDTQVLPELTLMLGEHPRFKGETIRLVSLDGGRPTDRSSRLHQAVQAHVTQRLLKNPGVRIALPDQAERSCAVTEQVVYLLGVEIERDGSGYHKLNIGMIDVAESVWVSGVNHTWRGRLTATETAALAQEVASAPAGTVDNPLPVGSSRQIAESMHRHLRCAHPEGLDGPVYLAPAAEPELNRVLASLRSELATAPIVALTGDQDASQWVLSLSTSHPGTGGRLRQLGLLLTEQQGQVTQQVATVYVSGWHSTGATPADTQIAEYDRQTNGELLSEMQLAPAASEGICDVDAARSRQCAEVSFHLQEDAYLFVLSSSDRRLTSTSCESRLVQASAGERRYRLRLPPSSGTLPDAGVYAIAVRDRQAASAISRHIRTGVCSRPLAGSSAWLTGLDTLLETHAGSTEWRAIHVSHAPDGIERL